MRTLRYLGDMKVAVVEVDEPHCREDEVLIRVEASGICGSEKGPLREGRDGNVGHEAAGVVLQAPAGCEFQPGERVGVSGVRGCGRCSACIAGVEVRCATPAVQVEMHSDKIVVAPSTLRRLPPGTDPASAVLLSGDGLGVPVRGLRRAPHEAGETVLVLGLGPVGLAHTLVRAFHGARVAAVEPSQVRRDLALSFGAERVFSSLAELDAEPRLVIEASGRAEAVEECFRVVAKGGVVLQSGECSRAEFSPSAVISREITYVGSWFYAREDYDDILRIQELGLRGERLVTHELPADDAADAYEAMLSAESGKVVLRWS